MERRAGAEMLDLELRKGRAALSVATVLVLLVAAGFAAEAPDRQAEDTPTPMSDEPVDQPPGLEPAVPPSELASPPELTASTPPRRSFRRSLARISRMPDMFGDLYAGDTISTQANPEFIIADLPLAGASRRVKIAEHNKALTDDRWILAYNHFHNAVDIDRAIAPGLPPFQTQASHVDRITFGFEKSFLDGRCSFEVRMPFSSDLDLQSANSRLPAGANFEMEGGGVGDLAIILKRIIWQTDCGVLSVGCGINTPTGSDVTVRLPTLSIPARIEIKNDAVHFLPFAAYSAANETYFCHAFAQLDIAANGNRVFVRDALGGGSDGKMNSQNLLYLDAGAGAWLFRDSCGSLLTGLAAAVELHYTSTLQDADIVPLFPVFGALGSADSRFDVLNLTTGLHAELRGATDLRFAGVFPLSNGNDRFFDAEFQLTLIRRF